MVSTPRTPSPRELIAITEEMVKRSGMDTGTVLASVADAAIAVFDNYMTDSPGYHGRVAVIVWPGGPELTDTICLDRQYKASTIDRGSDFA